MVGTTLGIDIAQASFEVALWQPNLRKAAMPASMTSGWPWRAK